MCTTADARLAYPLHALELVVRRLLDTIGVVLEGGIAPGVVLLLLDQHTTNTSQRQADGDKKGGCVQNGDCFIPDDSTRRSLGCCCRLGVVASGTYVAVSRNTLYEMYRN